jgi:PAS domain S-box-containing protein
MGGRQAEAMDRLTRLQALTASLSEAVTSEQVADATLTQAASVLGACAGVVARLSGDGSELVVVHAAGYPAETVNALSRIPADARMPLCDAVRDQQPVLLSGLAERDARYPEFAAATGVRAEGALAALPLVIRGKAIAGMGLRFPTKRTFADEDRAFLLTIAGLCAQALERARLFDIERAARERAEQAETALRESEERLRAIIDNCPSAIFVKDPEGRYLLANKACEAYSREPAERAIGKTSYAYFPRELADHLGADDRKVLETGEALRYESVMPARGGTLTALTLKFPLRDAGGRPYAVCGIATDITELKRAAEALRASEERFARFMQHLPGLAWIKDEQGRYVYANDAAVNAFRKPRADLYGRTDEEVFPPATAAQFRENDRKALASGTGVRVIETLEHEDGVLHYSLVSKFPIPGPGGEAALVGGMAIDITEEMQTRAVLEESEERSRATFEQAAVGIAHVGLDGRWLRVNRKLCDIVGYQPDELLGLTFQDITHPQDLEADLARVRRLLAGEIKTYSMEKRYFRKDRSLVWINLTVSLVRSPQGQPKYFISVVEDITDKKQVRDALGESEERLRTLSDNLPLGAVYQGVIDPQGRRRCTYISAGVERLFGVTPAEVMADATVLYRLIHEEDQARVAGQDEAAFRTLAPLDCEFRSWTRSGNLIWVHARSATRRLVNCETVWEGIVIDVTSRKRAEEELARLTAESEKRRRLYEAALSNTPDLVYVFDLDHRFTYANEGLLRLWGKTWDEAIGKNRLELGYEAWHAAMHDREIEQVVATKQPIKGEVPFTGTFGRRIYEYIFVPVLGENGEVEAVAGTTRDVTEHHVLEQRLRDQAERLREADRRKDEFLAMLAHELRNPLAPIRNAAQIIRLLSPADPNLQRARDIIERQAQHLTRLVDDLLDVSRLTRGKITLQKEPVELATVIAQAVETSRPLIDARRHELAVTLPREPLQVEGDATRLAQVIANLLNNAAKYTPEGGHIGLTVEPRPGEAMVRVRDDGVGISAELLTQVFDVFAQGDCSLARSEGGLGIGLTLVKSLVEMHGGSVEAHSDGPGKGSELVVRLPTLGREPAPVAEGGEGGPPSPSRRVLVVDDNGDAAESLAMLLRAWGHEVRTTHDGLAALNAAEQVRPEVILLDIGLPRMDGYEVARRLRQRADMRDVLLVALTGYGQEEDRRRAKEAGFDAHLTKPANPTALQRLLAGSEQHLASMPRPSTT